MEMNDIIKWSGWIITLISFFINIIQYFHTKNANNKYEDFRNNASVLLEGIKISLTNSVRLIEESTPPPQAEIAISSLKGCAKTLVASINSWLKIYGLKSFVEDTEKNNQFHH